MSLASRLQTLGLVVSLALLIPGCERPEPMNHKPGDHGPSMQQERGFPIPPRAVRNASLGGATSVTPGRNTTLSVYDVDLTLDQVAAFYHEHLPEVTPAIRGDAVRFACPNGWIELVARSGATRITIGVSSQ